MNNRINQGLSKTKKVAFLLGATVLSFLIVFLIAEIALRLFYPQQQAMKWFSSSEKYGYVLKKNFYQEYRFLAVCRTYAAEFF